MAAPAVPGAMHFGIQGVLGGDGVFPFGKIKAQDTIEY